MSSGHLVASIFASWPQPIRWHVAHSVFGIQTDAENYYRKSIVLKDLAALPATVMGELRSILAA